MPIRSVGPAIVLSGLASLALLTACGATNPHTQTARAASANPSDRLSIKSSLTGHATLPHRIPWVATPSVPPDQISEVDFLIDGRLRWVERHAPYYYGDDGNFLVTSFLRFGPHTFTVKATTIGGRTASTTVRANVIAAPAPPSALAGSWKRFLKQSDPSAPPSGYWHLVINRVGWKIYDTSGGANLLDVAYPKSSLLEVRTGMATGHDQVAGAAGDQDLNGWCNNEPGKPVRYRWSVRGSKLHLRYASGRACPGFTQFLTDAAITR